MLVVISDLHFEEELTDTIAGGPDQREVKFTRNLPPKVYRAFFSHLADEAQHQGAKRLDLVLAGDIFDIHRTSLWFADNPSRVEPFVNNCEVSGALEELVLKIIQAIGAESRVKGSLTALQMFAAGKYWRDGEQPFPVPVSVSYLPGNHDRLANATPAIRLAVRKTLGLPPVADPFPHVLTFDREKAIIRHGHEYDRYNLAIDVGEMDEIPLHLPGEAFDESPIGDFVTVNIASRLPTLFRKYHGEEAILSDRLLRTVYSRLLEFDDLRPQSALLNFVLHIPERFVEPNHVWKVLVPVLYELLEEVHDHPFLHAWLEKMDKKWQIDVVDIIQTVLALKAWRLPGGGIPLGLAQFISNTAISKASESHQVERLVSKESAIRRGDYHFLIAGHTHKPAVELLSNDDRGQRYYVNTGTWRNQVPATPDFNQFGRLKSLTYVVLYGPDEDLSDAPAEPKLVSMDFWSGLTQRWFSSGPESR